MTPEGQRYIDHVLGWGSLILGHADKDVMRAVSHQAGKGFYFGATSPEEIALAREISKALPFAQQVRFTVSGTEAVMGALRLARGYTGRDAVVMFEHSYHGHADHLLARAGSGLATCGIPLSQGVPRSFLEHTVVLPYGDREALERAFRKKGHRIAAVILEPVGGNYGVIPPDVPFLKLVRRLTHKSGVLLVADEVITGFRFAYGSFLETLGITPDLICLGKIIGGGMPAGCYGGPSRIMRHLAPLGGVYQASTFSGHPVCMASGFAALRKLRSRRSRYKSLTLYARQLSWALQQQALCADVPVKVAQYGPMFSLRFENDAQFRAFYRSMLSQGVYLAPSQFEANFISFAHTGRELKKTVAAAANAFSVAGDLP
jgi:glutamate-1-semialdehyde 2,1-aminomutase